MAASTSSKVAERSQYPFLCVRALAWLFFFFWKNVNVSNLFFLISLSLFLSFAAFSSHFPTPSSLYAPNMAVHLEVVAAKAFHKPKQPKHTQTKLKGTNCEVPRAENGGGLVSARLLVQEK
jgi:hypothetical protein